MLVVDMLTNGENYSGVMEDFPNIEEELWQEELLSTLDLEVRKFSNFFPYIFNVSMFYIG